MIQQTFVIRAIELVESLKKKEIKFKEFKKYYEELENDSQQDSARVEKEN